MYGLEGKTLLIMDSSALAACAVKRAQKLGIHVIVANFYPVEKSASKQVADESVDIDISNIDAMVDLVKEKQIDGIFVGWTDSHLPFYCEICSRAGLPCCGTKEQFEILSNDKRLFKEACLKYGVPTIPEYHIDMRFKKEDLDQITYPALIKPADGSGSRGVQRCDSEEELIQYYSDLFKLSKSKKILCEKYIDSPKEIYLHYTVQNGVCSLSSAFMKHKAIGEDGVASSAILHVFPSSYIDDYREKAEPAVIRMFEGLDLQNCVVMMQGFIYDNEFYFYESGLRMGGEQFYVFADPLNGINALDMMIEFSLTGRMTCGDIKKDNPKFSKVCCNYYISLEPGKIARIEGYEEINEMPQVLQITSFKKVGSIVKSTNSLDRVIYRLHVMEDTPEQLAYILEIISKTLRIISETGEEMQIEQLTFERALAMISDS